ncbi:uncharacterized protein A4U43_C06F12590 [Asparagus officinalis]|uniref:ShKT domain-containing protein n=1 Tax=Asparagus officinalis TaxID=4686 RepID=A0A5P1EQJ8_ASPOF|nr:uncharacterized protein A4U43_C06F12590 [Asparagus officinalis]
MIGKTMLYAILFFLLGNLWTPAQSSAVPCCLPYDDVDCKDYRYRHMCFPKNLCYSTLDECRADCPVCPPINARKLGKSSPIGA